MKLGLFTFSIKVSIKCILLWNIKCYKITEHPYLCNFLSCFSLFPFFLTSGCPFFIIFPPFPYSLLFLSYRLSFLHVLSFHFLRKKCFSIRSAMSVHIAKGVQKQHLIQIPQEKWQHYCEFTHWCFKFLDIFLHIKELMLNISENEDD